MTTTSLYNEILSQYRALTPPVITKDYRTLAKTFRSQIKALEIEDIFALCERFLGHRERGMTLLAYQIIDFVHTRFQRHHFSIFDLWVTTYISDWWDCDDLMTHAMMRFYHKYPDIWDEVLQWTTSNNFAVRRCPPVLLVVSARNGIEPFDRIFQVCDILYHDSHYLVQKGYGWLLKEASKKRPKPIITYLEQHAHDMDRTAFRYALEKLPKHEKERLMSL